METAVAIQIFVAVFCGFLAARKNRSPVAWALIGLVPVVGVLAAIVVPRAEPRPAGRRTEPSLPRSLPRPKRCCGRYIPDCRGCPYFRRALFQTDEQKDRGRVGYCEFFEKDLLEQEESEGPEILFED